MNLIFWALVASLVINIVMFVPAFLLKTDKLTDISYALTFLFVGVVGYSHSAKTTVQFVTFLMVYLWAIRLGSFLFMRINKMKVDHRFDGMREKFFAFLRFWILQGVTVFIVLLSAIYVWKQTVTSLTLLSIFGLVVFLAGLLIEAMADAQKFKFNNQPKNKGRWIDTGVWRWSRHPNYLGEIMVWVGVYLYVVSSLHGSDRLYALVSPLYIIVLLLFVSGIPLLEKSAITKWGSDKAYQKYKNEVPVLIPTLKSIKR